MSNTETERREIDANSPDAIRAKVRDLDQRAADLRIEIHMHTDERTAARGLLAQCAADFENGLGPKVTPESNTRDYLAASLAERAAHARGDNLPPVPEPGRSVVDRQAMYSGNAAGDASDHVRANSVTGGFVEGRCLRTIKAVACCLRSAVDREWVHVIGR
jgi:hypothetical protein